MIPTILWTFIDFFFETRLEIIFDISTHFWHSLSNFGVISRPFKIFFPAILPDFHCVCSNFTNICTISITVFVCLYISFIQVTKNKNVDRRSIIFFFWIPQKLSTPTFNYSSNRFKKVIFYNFLRQNIYTFFLFSCRELNKIVEGGYEDFFLK